jgi:hypothetical protein
MPASIVLAILATVVVTGGLTLILARMNQPKERRDRSGGHVTTAEISDGGGSGRSKPDHDAGDAGADAGGDGGGD